MSKALFSRYDAIIMGGGPAGASTGAILAEHGHRVVILEREKFPRYHIGESLIPFAYPPLDRLGLIPAMQLSSFQKKFSVAFVQPDGRQSRTFYFHQRYGTEPMATTWQVKRSEFDEMLLRNAARKGAEVREQCAVTSLIRDADGTVTGVLAETPDGNGEEISAPITIDATGKEAFSSHRLGWRMAESRLNKVAVWSYYKGCDRGSSGDEGAATVAVISGKGWFWHLPMQDDMVSVGVVAEGKYLTRDGCRDPAQMLQREIAANPWMRSRLTNGRQVGVPRLTAEFSKHSKFGAAPGLLMVGDAFAFMDPVFSTGVMMALKSGVLAGDAVHEALQAGDCSPVRFTAYSDLMRESVENLRRLIYAFYAPDFSFAELITRFPEAADAVTACLAGDLNQDYSELWACIREFAHLPEPLPYGAPLVPKSV
ncbi:MAG: NAD(P)/FAD-dependent oxidoreductase [Verrucomicrobiota bacterium]